MVTGTSILHGKTKIRALKRMGVPRFEASKITSETIKLLVPAFESHISNSIDNIFDIFPLCCGSGKTETVKAFLETWKSEGFNPQGSVIILLSRLSEITDIITDIKLDEDDYAVVSSDDELNNMGVGKECSDKAPILFTTHAMFRTLTRGGNSGSVPFNKIKQFYFHGKPRSLRIWDESLIPAQHVVIRVDAVATLPEALGTVNPMLAALLRRMLPDLSQLVQGQSYLVPSELLSFDHDGLRPGAAGEQSVLNVGQQRAVGDLIAMAGQVLVACSDNRTGVALVGATNRLPNDFAPAIILDASAGLRATYQIWAASDPRVVIHPAVANNYENVSFHVWKTKAGRSSLQHPATRKHMLQKAAEVINADTEDWLVIHYKQGAFDIPKELTAMVTDSARLRFVHWGNHHGTNAYRTIKKVLVIGSFLQANSFYAALHAASSDPTPGTHSIDAVEEVKRGEVAHNFLQAICRSNVRNTVDGKAGEATVNMIVSGRPDPIELLTATFPNATVNEWQPDPLKLSRQGEVVARTMLEHLPSTGCEVRMKVVASAAGIGNASGLTRVIHHPAMQIFMNDNGIVKFKQSLRRIGYAG